MIRLLKLLFFLFTAQGLFGQVKIRNTGGAKVFVAICYFENSKGWTTRGWFPVEPDAEKNLYNYTELSNPNFYYCATIENCDKGYFGTMPLYVNIKDAFTITNADKPLQYSDPQITTYKFNHINLKGKSSYVITLNPINLICNGKPQGKWNLGLDKEGEYAQKEEDVVFHREITFDNGRPIGWCKDFYDDSTLKAEFKLISYNPVVYDGKCTWYDRNGNIEREAIYKNGALTSDKSMNSYGQTIEKKAVLKVVELPVQRFYINSTSNETWKGGNSRTVFYVNLPSNTVEWYYEFTASRDEQETSINQSQFSTAAKLTSLIDRTGLVKGAVNLMTAPPGGNKCDIYLLEGKYYSQFRDNGTWKYRAEFSRQNYSSGIVQVNDLKIQKPIIGIKNNDGWYGIHVSIQITAVVSEVE